MAKEVKESKLTQEQRDAAKKKETIMTSLIIGGALAVILGIFFSVMDKYHVGLMEVINILGKDMNIFHHLSLGLFKGVFFGALIGLAIFFYNWSIMLPKIGVEKKGEEIDTSRFATSAEVKKLSDWSNDIENYNKFEDIFKTVLPGEDYNTDYMNIILSKNARRPVVASACLGNNNVMVVGGAGSGKSQGYVLPNILQMNSSYIVTDPSGELISATGKTLREHGYKVKIFNIANLKYSNCYNPLVYIEEDTDVDTIIEILINNTSANKEGGGGDNQFFIDAEKLLYSACIFYLKDYCNDASKKNFASVLKMINSSAVDENNSQAKSELDLLFEKIPQSSIAAQKYKSFKQAAGRTLKSIIISCVVRLGKFMTPQLSSLTSKDDMDLSSISEEKTALFIITSQAEETYNFLAAMLYTQFFLVSYRKGEAQNAKTGRAHLPLRVHCIMDEFANIGEVPNFPSYLSTMRKYGINATMILQDPNQLKAMYKDEWQTAVNNCSTWIYLGGNKEPETLKFWVDIMGKKTIRMQNDSYSKSGKGGSSASVQASGRELMTISELERFPEDECIISQFGNVVKYPIKDKKAQVFDFVNKTKAPCHMRAEMTGILNRENAFNYQEMPEYFNDSSTYNTLLKAQTEALRIREKALKKNAELKPEDAEKITENKETVEKNFEYYLEYAIEKVVENYNKDADISIGVYEEMQSNYLSAILKEISAQLGKAPIILFTKREFTDGVSFVGVCLGRNEKDVIFDIISVENNPFVIKTNRMENSKLCVVIVKETNYEAFKEQTEKDYLRRNAKPNNVTADGKSPVVESKESNTSSSEANENIVNEDLQPQ